MLITSDSMFNFNKYAYFEAASFKGGVLAAKASEKWELSAQGENYEFIKIEASYTLSFEAKVIDESLLTRSLSSENKSMQAASANLPERGAAQGTLTVSGTTVKLSYSYAMQQKVENLDEVMTGLLKDRPGEITTVLLTDKPISKEYLAFSFDRSVPQDIYGLYLYIDKSGELRWSLIRYPSGRMGIDDEKAVIRVKLENGRVVGIVEAEYRSIASREKLGGYSVSFDAPLKN